MAKGRKISVEEAKKWLSEYEAGRGIDDIAGAYRRARSTIWKGIHTARRDRELQAARQSVLVDAYSNHFKVLLDAADHLLRSLVADDPRNALERGRWADLRLINALRSHIPHSPIWEGFVELEKLTFERRSAEQDVDHFVERELMSMPDLHAVLNQEGFTRSVVFAVCELAKNHSLSDRRYEESDSSLIWAAFTLKKKGGTTAAEVKRAHQSLIDRIDGQGLVQPIRRVMGKWDEARKAVDDEVFVLVHRSVLPGRCNLCPE